MKKLTNWSARRAGAKITIDAHSADGSRPIKVTGVESIKGSDGKVIAVDMSGEKYELAF